MPPPAKAVSLIAAVVLLCHGCDAFIPSCREVAPAKSRRFHISVNRETVHLSPQPPRMSSNEAAMPSGDSSVAELRDVPPIVRKLNASTKWLVTLAHTYAVWSRPSRFHGPYIVVGSIAAVYLTDVLKGVINQGRPKGAPFADPGMPSSHALVSFFSAAAWMSVVAPTAAAGTFSVGQALLLASASLIAVLRVACGFHSVAQIVVGGLLGSFLGRLWIVIGQVLYSGNSRLTFGLAWTAYLSGSAFFIVNSMSKWTTRDKDL